MRNAPFRKDIEPLCEYCRYSVELGGGDLACYRRGFTRVGESCRGFRYNAIKRVPERPRKPDTSRFTKEDFEL